MLQQVREGVRGKAVVEEADPGPQHDRPPAAGCERGEDPRHQVTPSEEVLVVVPAAEGQGEVRLELEFVLDEAADDFLKEGNEAVPRLLRERVGLTRLVGGQT